MSETGDQCQHNPEGATSGANNRGRCQLQVDRTPPVASVPRLRMIKALTSGSQGKVRTARDAIVRNYLAVSWLSWLSADGPHPARSSPGGTIARACQSRTMFNQPASAGVSGRSDW